MVANCVCTGNQYCQEWVIENAAGLVQQLGLDVRAVAREKANPLDTDSFAQIGAGEPACAGRASPFHMAPAPAGPFDPEDFVRRVKLADNRLQP
jgi:hypothetical protein